MAIAFDKDASFVLNHGEFVRTSYRNTRHWFASKLHFINFAFKEEFFSVEVPYILNRQSQRKKTRKRKIPANEEEILEENYHNSVTPDLLKTLNEIPPQALAISYNSTGTSGPSSLNKSHILTCGKCSDIFKDMCFRISFNYDRNLIKLKSENEVHFTYSHIMERYVIYEGDQPRTICIAGQYYLLPRRCSFFLSDITKLNPLVEYASNHRCYDVIVIDPPWENKSAKRSKKYPWLSLGEIAKLPLSKLASRDCIVFVWVTNNQKIHKFVKKELFPLNGMQFVAEWHWMKVTDQGKPVVEFTSMHKRPYETIIIGKMGEGTGLCIPGNVLVSIPCTYHSHKPPLDELISKLTITSNPNCLEMFARNLKPGWTSWGNDVLELQNVKHYEFTM